MPSIPFTQALTASQRGFRPLANWDYRRLPWPAYVRVYLDTTGAAGTVEAQVRTGAQQITAGPVSVGATAGVIPNPLNNPVFAEFMANAGDELIVSIDELAAATPTVNGIVYADPA